MRRPKTLSRRQRWEEACREARDAIAAAFEPLRELQSEFQDWRDNLPENLEGSATAEKLDAILDLDFESIECPTLDEAEEADLPLGFGRD